jgi:hypothetical protein
VRKYHIEVNVLERIFRDAKSALKRRFPPLVAVYGAVYRRWVLRPRLRRMSVETVFEKIHRTNGWEGTESPSGRGSTLAETTAIRVALPKLIARFNIRSLLDIPCGDGHWMSQVDMKLDRYIGADIVGDLVANCSARWPTGRTDEIAFVRMSLIADQLPSVDLVFCRDCLVHLSFSDALAALENLRLSGSTYLMTTTFPGRRNYDIATGEWRPIDLQEEPFRFPPPLVLINEQCVDPPGYFDKSMGLWRIEDLSRFR